MCKQTSLIILISQNGRSTLQCVEGNEIPGSMSDVKTRSCCPRIQCHKQSVILGGNAYESVLVQSVLSSILRYRSILWCERKVKTYFEMSVLLERLSEVLEWADSGTLTSVTSSRREAWPISLRTDHKCLSRSYKDLELTSVTVAVCLNLFIQ